MNVSVIIPQQTLAYLSFTKKAYREFFDLGMTLAQAYENMTSKGFIKPLDPTPMPNLLPPTWNLNEYVTTTRNPTIKLAIASTLNM